MVVTSTSGAPAKSLQQDGGWRMEYGSSVEWLRGRVVEQSDRRESGLALFKTFLLFFTPSFIKDFHRESVSFRAEAGPGKSRDSAVYITGTTIPSVRYRMNSSRDGAVVVRDSTGASMESVLFERLDSTLYGVQCSQSCPYTLPL